MIVYSSINTTRVLLHSFIYEFFGGVFNWMPCFGWYWYWILISYNCWQKLCSHHICKMFSKLTFKPINMWQTNMPLFVTWTFWLCETYLKQIKSNEDKLCNLKEIPEQISICKIFNRVQALTSWLLLVDMQKIFIEKKLALETGELVFLFCVFSGDAYFLEMEIISLIVFVH